MDNRSPLSADDNGVCGCDRTLPRTAPLCVVGFFLCARAYSLESLSTPRSPRIQRSRAASLYGRPLLKVHWHCSIRRVPSCVPSLDLTSGGTPCQMARPRVKTVEAESGPAHDSGSSSTSTASVQRSFETPRLGSGALWEALDAPHRTVSRPSVGRHAVSDDTSTSKNGGGQEGSLTAQAARARPQHRF